MEPVCADKVPHSRTPAPKTFATTPLTLINTSERSRPYPRAEFGYILSLRRCILLGKKEFFTVKSLQPYAHSILRIVTGFVFSLHGFQKLFGYFGGLNGHGATAHFFSLFWLAGFLEAFGGVLIILGLLTSPVALI